MISVMTPWVSPSARRVIVPSSRGSRRPTWTSSPRKVCGFRKRIRHGFVVLAQPRFVLTGLYNHLNGVVNNHTPFPTNSVTYAGITARRQVPDGLHWQMAHGAPA